MTTTKWKYRIRVLHVRQQTCKRFIHTLTITCKRFIHTLTITFKRFIHTLTIIFHVHSVADSLDNGMSQTSSLNKVIRKQTFIEIVKSSLYELIAKKRFFLNLHKYIIIQNLASKPLNTRNGIFSSMLVMGFTFNRFK